jgi:hypothetical protein
MNGFLKKLRGCFAMGKKGLSPAERQKETAPRAKALGAAMVLWIVGAVTTPCARARRLGLGFTTVV